MESYPEKIPKLSYLQHKLSGFADIVGKRYAMVDFMLLEEFRIF